MAFDSSYVQSMATQLAQYDIQPMVTRANRQESGYTAKLSGLTELENAVKKFQTTVKSLKSLGSNSAVVKNKATLSSEAHASASVASSAQSGSYDIFVSQLATRHQAAVTGLTDDNLGATGSISLAQNGSQFSIDLSQADADASGNVSLSELATAINKAQDNTGVSATLVRANGTVSLVLSADESGASNAISLDTSALPALTTGLQTLTAAQDAEVRLGGENGIVLTNSKNQFDNIIDGVSMTFTKAHQAGEAPLTIKVEQDQAGSQAQVQKLVDAYNTLAASFKSLTASGVDGAKRGALAGDSSVSAIKNMINNALRANYGGDNLLNFGIRAGADGQLQLDSTRFNKMLAESPDAIDKLFSDKDGLINTLEKNLGLYTSAANGVFQSRKESLNANIKKIDIEFENIQKKYDTYYDRYVKQYSNMMQIMSSMEQTNSMFMMPTQTTGGSSSSGT